MNLIYFPKIFYLKISADPEIFFSEMSADPEIFGGYLVARLRA